MKYLISIAYDGSKYNGLQKLKGKNTVQGELERVLSKMNESPVSVKAAGRTDKGVHALDQKCHFELTKETTPFRLRYYIDKSTSKYLYVKDCMEVEDENFHARFSVKKKTYLYKINVGKYNPLEVDYIYQYNKELDVKKMKAAKVLFEGPHNYRAFVSGEHKTCDSIIDYIKIDQKEDIINIEIKGKAFYTYMVRNIVGALISIGSGKITENQIKSMLADGKKIVEYTKAPASGLYLKEVEY